MATEDRISFSELLRKRLQAEVTAEALERILKAVTEVLEGFDIEELAPDGMRRDDLLEKMDPEAGKESYLVDAWSWGRPTKCPMREITVEYDPS